jgi:CHAT domain-containing protein/Flp pilus assembly protein TadD
VHRLLKILLPLLLLFPKSGVCQPIPPQAKLDSLRSQLAQGQYRSVIEACQSWLTQPQLDSQSELTSDILTLKGTAHRYFGQAHLALPEHHRALQLREKQLGPQHLKTSNSHLNLGNTYRSLHQLDTATLHLKKAYSIKQRLFPEQPDRLINVRNSLGHTSLLTGDTNAALTWLLPAYGTLLNTDGSGQELIENTQLIIQAYLQQQQWEQAEHHLQEVATRFSASDPTLKWILQKLKGDLALKQGHFQEAHLAFQQAQMEQHPEFLISGGDTYANLGTAAAQMGDFKNALLYFDQAYSHYQKENKLPEAVDLIAQIGLVYKNRGDFERAEEKLLEALSTYLELEDQYPLGARIGLSYMNLGSLFLLQEENRSFTIDYFLAATELLPSEGAQDYHARNARYLAQAYLYENQPDAAQEQMDRAFQLLPDQSDPIRQFEFQLIQGQIYQQQLQFDQAINTYQQALSDIGYTPEQNNVRQYPYQTVNGLLHLARCFRDLALKNKDQSSWKRVLTTTQTGIDLFELLRNELQPIESQLQLQAAFPSLFETAVEAAYHLGQNDPAFLTEALQISDRHKSYTSQYLLQKIKGEALPYSEAAFATPFSIPNLQEQLRENETLLSYQWTEKQLFVFVINHDHFHVHSIEQPAAILEAIEQVFLSISRRPDLIAPSQKAIQYASLVERSAFLHQQLIEPISPFLREQLTIIPDSWLWYLPFEFLIKKTATEPRFFRSHHYLINEHAIGYAYSIQEFLQSKTLTESRFSKPLLAIAPEFENNSYGFLPLQESKNEVLHIQKTLPIADIWVNGTDSEARFLTEAPNYRVIHISTHGELNNRRPFASNIAFSEIRDTLENELLFAGEIMDDSIPADLLVLSACQTAGGKLNRGEGFLSIAWALRMAGVKSLIASLWNVDDPKGASLMTQFYLQADQGLSTNQALQQAKLQYIQAAPHEKAHPFYWAGFRNLGANRDFQISSSSNRWLFSWMGAGLLFAVFGFFIFRFRKSRLN